jgi:hypothetical protein
MSLEGAVVSLEISTVLEHKENLNNAFLRKRHRLEQLNLILRW